MKSTMVESRIQWSTQTRSKEYGFLLPRRLTRSAINYARVGSQIFDSLPSHKIKLADRVSSQSKRKTVHFLKQICVDHCILLLKYMSNHMHFITNGYKRFSFDQLVRSKATYFFKPYYITPGSFEKFVLYFQFMCLDFILK